jgi:hypothetical protein
MLVVIVARVWTTSRAGEITERGSSQGFGVLYSGHGPNPLSTTVGAISFLLHAYLAFLLRKTHIVRSDKENELAVFLEQTSSMMETADRAATGSNKRPAGHDWLVESHANGKRRSPYAPRACDACRKRKGKCSGCNPCEYCSGRALQCCYSAGNSADDWRGGMGAPTAVGDLDTVQPPKGLTWTPE